MHEKISRNGGGAGYAAAERPEGLAGRPSPGPAVPPFEAAWLRAVGCTGRLGAAGGGGDRVVAPLVPAPALPAKPSH